LIDSKIIKQQPLQEQVPTGTVHLNIKEEIFLFYLWTEESSSQPNGSYTKDLLVRDYYGTTITYPFLAHGLRNKVNHSGRSCKCKLVPKDKFHPENIVQYMGSCMVLEKLPGHRYYPQMMVILIKISIVEQHL
jgi:hypothetical protein